MAKVGKISVTLDEESLAWLRARAETNRTTLAAELREAVRQWQLQEARRAYLEASGDPITAEDVAHVWNEMRQWPPRG